MLELLAPAGSLEGVRAAVSNGADAVYMGFGNYNARHNAKNFTDAEFGMAAEYCRMRGVKTYVTLNTLVSDREMGDAVETARRACRLGADAILVQDLGVLRAVRQYLPDMPIHASTQMSIHNLDGVKLAAAMGISRVVLARELSMAEIADICRQSPIEIEVFAHGALCMCYSGQCYMSSVIGRRSGNRGRCAQPCRLEYSTGGKGPSHPLSLKDNCLVSYLRELEDIGVACVKIEGRMRRPEYSAIVSGIYSKAIRNGTPPTAEEMRLLENTFSRQGFTDAYIKGEKGPKMLGIREDSNKTEFPFFSTVRKNYENTEFSRVPVHFAALVQADEPVRLAVRDSDGNSAAVEGPVPDPAFNRGLTPALFKTQLQKTGGTPFTCSEVSSSIEEGLSLPVSAINDMRRRALSELLNIRRALPPRREREYTEDYKLVNSKEPPSLTVSVLRASQLSPKLAEMGPRVVYVPLGEFSSGGMKYLTPFLEDPDVTVAAILPRIIHDRELDDIESQLINVKNYGVSDALVGNMGHIVFAKELGFNVRGDFGLNVYNSQTLKTLKELGLRSATLSFELRMEQIKAVSKVIDSELIVYGRLPLMITENCIVKNSTGICSCDNFAGLTDRHGFTFPIVREYGCRNTILNSKKLFLADRSRDYIASGLWGVRLMFTKENPAECAAITARYLNAGSFEPTEFTRGLYYRGVE